MNDKIRYKIMTHTTKQAIYNVFTKYSNQLIGPPTFPNFT